MEMKNEFLDFLEKLASLIAETFGNNCEVVISDLDRPESVVLAIFNNHVTNRKVGDPLIPHALRRIENSADDYYINFEDFKGGKLLKTSTLSAHIGGRHIAFCINYDYTHLDGLRQSLDEFLTMQRDSDLIGGSNYAPVIDEAIREAIKLARKPVSLMNKKDRLQVLSYLEEHGILKLQKSVQAIAQYLVISRYTVYNYLNELRAEKKMDSTL
ncbi:MAG: helix-turn-helix transcriptional regulator [Synergistaceae bacterium]|jgi:predicted transcriptional regulator YheO|nr:helix-turn-helix transcriptional regulator [Synergistaceae bacterium]